MNFPQFGRLMKICAFPEDDRGSEALVECPGNSVFFFPGDPEKHPESLDAAVILPELFGVFQGRFSIVLVKGGAEGGLPQRFGFSVRPALVFIRDGGYVGAMTGIRDWNECLKWFESMFDSPVKRPPMPLLEAK